MHLRPPSSLVKPDQEGVITKVRFRKPELHSEFCRLIPSFKPKNLHDRIHNAGAKHPKLLKLHLWFFIMRFIVILHFLKKRYGVAGISNRQHLLQLTLVMNFGFLHSPVYKFLKSLSSPIFSIRISFIKSPLSNGGCFSNLLLQEEDNN